VLPHHVHWGPRRDVNLSREGDVLTAYQATISEGMVADQVTIGVRTSRLGSLLAPDDLRRCTPSPGGLEPGRPLHDAIADRHAWVPNRRSAPP
jgi:hypothetical protein